MRLPTYLAAVNSQLQTLYLLTNTDLKSFLDDCVERFNQPHFIENDPVGVPKRFSKLQDIEITAFWTAMLAWGQRKTIINKANELFGLMDNAPHDFILNHQEADRKPFLNFVHRTFQATDTLYFLAFFQWFYQNHQSLEESFLKKMKQEDAHVEAGLKGFRDLFFSLPDAPQRTKKHVPSPMTKSTCKRLNMFLRWMVRCDDRGVDFGLWKQIKPSQLLIPLDVHVERHARRFGLLTRPQTDWLAVLELTERLREFDPNDPVKYDFALFGLGANLGMRDEG
ncbi:MAG: TIGR02757 family protein [Saprospiraceae bacterium]|nr:TIGR02757 family protein [Saprospiraceae bacterium]